MLVRKLLFVAAVVGSLTVTARTFAQDQPRDTGPADSTYPQDQPAAREAEVVCRAARRLWQESFRWNPPGQEEPSQAFGRVRALGDGRETGGAEQGSSHRVAPRYAGRTDGRRARRPACRQRSGKTELAVGPARRSDAQHGRNPPYAQAAGSPRRGGRGNAEPRAALAARANGRFSQFPLRCGRPGGFRCPFERAAAAAGRHHSTREKKDIDSDNEPIYPEDQAAARRARPPRKRWPRGPRSRFTKRRTSGRTWSNLGRMRPTTRFRRRRYTRREMSVRRRPRLSRAPPNRVPPTIRPEWERSLPARGRCSASRHRASDDRRRPGIDL